MGDWDDLRFFLAVADHGSTLAAGAALGVSQSTVFRRIAALEAGLGLALFDRRASGYGLTAAGKALIAQARAVASAVGAFEETASGEARREASVIRLSVPDVALDYLLPPVMAGFRERFAHVRLEVIASPRPLDLAAGEADVALRSNPASDPDLFGRRLVEERPALAASRAYADAHPLPREDAELAGHDLIGMTGLLATVLGDWFDRAAPPDAVRLHPDSLSSALSAVRGGAGLAVLPQFIIDREPDLVAAPLILPLAPFELWVLTHRRLRGSTPVRALMDLVADYVLATTPASRRLS